MNPKERAEELVIGCELKISDITKKFLCGISSRGGLCKSCKKKIQNTKETFENELEFLVEKVWDGEKGYEGLGNEILEEAKIGEIWWDGYKVALNPFFERIQNLREAIDILNSSQMPPIVTKSDRSDLISKESKE